MKKIRVCDLTLRECGGAAQVPGFREKIEIVKMLDAMGVDVIETGEFSGSRTDELFLHTVSPMLKNAAISCRVGWDEASAEAAWNAVKSASRPILTVAVPVSTVQMEYICHKKPSGVLELIEKLTAKAKSLCENVEFSALDATRADPAFLKSALETAVKAGATSLAVTDSVGTILPREVAGFMETVRSAEGADKLPLCAEFSNASGLGAACSISALDAGASQIKAAVGIPRLPSLDAVAQVFRHRGDALGYETSLDHTKLSHGCEAIEAILLPAPKNGGSAIRPVASGEDFTLNREDDIQTVAAAVAKLGYELDAADLTSVFEDFTRLSQKKPIGPRELEAIVAGSAMRCAPVYKLKSFVITTGNLFSSSAQICLEKDGRELHGISMGDGPIDASFMAIESVIGHHFELDDFQIRSVTEGREAMGEAIVKLRRGGKLYSGIGLSTDVIGSSIHAYLSALNKIMSEEQ